MKKTDILKKEIVDSIVRDLQQDEEYKKNIEEIIIKNKDFYKLLKNNENLKNKI